MQMQQSKVHSMDCRERISLYCKVACSSLISQYLQHSPKVNGFHETDTWSRSFKVMYDNKEYNRSLRSLVRRRNHYTEGLL
mgnify:CR=1 FL=1